MPRASKAQSAANHQRVMENSARLFRERGLHGVSVADLMQSASLTHGGFYGHFASKEQLAVEAVSLAFRQSVERWRSRVASESRPEASLRALVDGYLTPHNRDAAGTSCPAPALIADVAREPKDSAVRDQYRDGVQELLKILESSQSTQHSAERRQSAVAQFALMVGALALSRATQGDPLSDEFLSSARRALLEGVSPVADDSLDRQL
jgi:TetR/AcrR family transcriptional regulator, transcriptional repressor for nem operon